MLRISLIGLSTLLNLLPRWLLYFFGDSLGSLWYFCLPIRRSVVLENIQLAYADSITRQQQRALARANFRHYGRLVLETLLSITWRIDDYRRHIQLHGLEYAQAALAAGKGGFFLTCHLGPFEFLPGVGLAGGLPLDIVVKQARNPVAEQFLQWYRTRLGARVLLESGTAKDILRALSNNRFVGFVQDQFMGPPIGLPVQFFGKLAGSGVSLALLTEKRPVPVLPVYAYRDQSQKLHVVIEPPIDFSPLSEDRGQRLFEKTQIFNNVLERIIRKHPEQWFWLHRRWKEYRGEPRWRLKPALAFCFLAFFLTTRVNAAAPAAESTGITIPPDPSISAPAFKLPPGEEAEESEKNAPLVTSLPSARETKPSKKAKFKRRKGKKVELATEPPPPAVVKPVFETVSAEKIPFEVGERMELQLSWVGLSAGNAILEVQPGPVIDGRKTVKLWGNILSSKLVDAIYHVNNTVESIIDATGVIPYKFLLHMVESAQKKETKVTFDHNTKKAHYWSERISSKWGNETVNRDDDLVPQAKDMFSALYYLRSLDYVLNKKQTFPIYENGKNWEVELLPVASELMTTNVGVFQCWKLLVKVKLNNVLRPTGDIFMWISNDSKRYIVKFDAKIKIGSLYGNLVSIKDR